MNTIQSTAYGAKLLIRLLMGHNPDIDEKSTMNERLGIQPAARPLPTERVKLGILVVGNQGHRTLAGTDGIPLLSPKDHLANHASVYGPMPFCMRPVDDDLTLAEREKYALRKEDSHGGVNYYKYYGLRMDIDPEDVVVTMKKVTIEDGNKIEEDFVPDTSDLYPEPVSLPEMGAVTSADVSIVVSAILRVRLDAVAIEEFINVAKILYNGDERYAVMSEFALCTAADRDITTTSSGGQIQFTEAIGTQVYSFNLDHRAVYFNSQELTLDFDLGNQVPLLGTASIPTLETIG